MTEHGTNEPSPLEVEPSTAGASGAGDLDKWLAGLRVHLYKVRQLAARGNIPAARMVLADAMLDLDDIQAALDERDRGGIISAH